MRWNCSSDMCCGRERERSREGLREVERERERLREVERERA